MKPSAISPYRACKGHIQDAWPKKRITGGSDHPKVRMCDSGQEGTKTAKMALTYSSC